MKVTKLFIEVLKDSFKIVFNSPKLWLFFYLFVLMDLLIVTFVPGLLNKILLVVLNLIMIALPGLKVEYLSLSKGEQKIPFVDFFPTLIYYFKKLFIVNLILLLSGSFFTAISNFIFVVFGSPGRIFFGYQPEELIRFIVFLPLAIVYFSLFHLFVVVLVKKRVGVIEAVKLSLGYIKKNKEVVTLVVLLSFLFHYPLSDFMVMASRYLSNSLSPLIINVLVSFVNVIVDLYFFAIWMALYNKKS